MAAASPAPTAAGPAPAPAPGSGPAVQSDFLARVTKYSLVQSSLDTLATSYQKYGRDSRVPLVSSTLKLAEDSVGTIKARALPLLEGHREKIAALDSFAVRQLDTIETTADTVASTASRQASKVQAVVASTKDAAVSHAACAQDRIIDAKDRLLDAKDNLELSTRDAIDALSDRMHDTVDVVSDRVHDTLDSVSDSLHNSLDKARVRASEHPLYHATVEASFKLEDCLAGVTEAAARVTENSVDYVLPADDAEEEIGDDDKEAATGDNEAAIGDKKAAIDDKKAAVEEPALPVEADERVLGQQATKALGRVRAVTNKAKARIYRRALGKLESAKLRSQSAVNALRPYTIDLISYDRTAGDQADDGGVADADAGGPAKTDVVQQLNQAYANLKTRLGQSLDAVPTPSDVLEQSRNAIAHVSERASALTAKSRESVTATLDQVSSLSSQARSTLSKAASDPRQTVKDLTDAAVATAGEYVDSAVMVGQAVQKRVLVEMAPVVDFAKRATGRANNTAAADNGADVEVLEDDKDLVDDDLAFDDVEEQDEDEEEQDEDEEEDDDDDEDEEEDQPTVHKSSSNVQFTVGGWSDGEFEGDNQ